MAKFIALLFCLVVIPTSAVTLTDDRGVQVTLTQPPQRIVTLLPSLAETVCVLGACNRLVGTDNFANWPEQVKQLPKLGGLNDTSLEGLVRLKPDLVLAARSTRLISRLEALGLKVLALEPENQADVRRVMHTVAKALQLPQADEAAQAIWHQAMDGMAQAKRNMPAKALGAKVYFEASTGGYAAGEASFIGEILRYMGLRNVVPSHMGPFPQLNPEFVVRANPDIILLAEPMAMDLQKRPGWSTMQAVKHQQICAFNSAQGDVLVRPGPRLGEAAQVIAQCLRRLYP
jgi:iron complex transport system substrate-binding protein